MNNAGLQLVQQFGQLSERRRFDQAHIGAAPERLKLAQNGGCVVTGKVVLTPVDPLTANDQDVKLVYCPDGQRPGSMNTGDRHHRIYEKAIDCPRTPLRQMLPGKVGELDW